jgi:hypothetical protein
MIGAAIGTCVYHEVEVGGFEPGRQPGEMS